MKKLLIVVLLFAVCLPLHAVVGGMPMEVLGKGAGVRSLSMGEAGVAGIPDATSVYWNPAALDSATKNEAYFSFETLYDEANYNFLSFVYPAGKIGGAGLSAGYLSYGTYEITNTEGETLGESSISDIFVIAGYGKTLFNGVQGGLSLKALVKSFGSETFTGFNTDLGLYKSLGENFDIAFVYRNVLPTSITYAEGEDKFIGTIRAGLGAKFLMDELKFCVDGEMNFIESDPLVFAGAEYTIMNHVSLRAGYNTMGNLSGGIGFNYNGFKVDYGLVNNEYVMSHKAALSYAFGGYNVAVKAEPPVFSPVGGNRKTYLRVQAETKYEIYRWKLLIFGPDGSVVKKWEGAGAPDASLVWDGLRDNGLPFKEGTYRAQLMVIDENDTFIKSRDINIKISTKNASEYPLFE